MKEKEFVTAIVLAAGRGTRMGTKIQKQYLDLCGKPVLYYSLHAFQESPLIDEILLVTGEQEIEYCRKEIVEKYQLTKVRKIANLILPILDFSTDFDFHLFRILRDRDG